MKTPIRRACRISRKSPIRHLTRLICFSIFLVIGIAQVQAQEDTNTPVEVATAYTGSISEFEYGQGTAKAARREYLVFQSSGRISYVKSNSAGGNLNEGDTVIGPGEQYKKGELLAELEHRKEDADLVSARARLDVARSGLRKSKSDYDRAERLRAGDAIAANQYEERKAAYEQALANVRSAEADLDRAQSGFDDNQLRAPFDGQIAFINIREGQYYSQQQFNASSEQLATRTAPIVLIDPASFEIIVNVPLNTGKRIKVGQVVYIMTQDALAELQTIGEILNLSLDDYFVTARVGAVSPAVSIEDRSMRVRITTPENKEIDLIDGDFVTVWFEIGRKDDAVIIPLNALLAKDNKYYAYILKDDNRVEKRELSTGLVGIDGMEIIEGVNTGDKVITKGKSRLRPGSQVDVVSVIEAPENTQSGGY